MGKCILIAIILLSVFMVACSVEKPIGKERDEHGCLVSAGYSWCESKQKCLRTWEENCPKEAPKQESSQEFIGIIEKDPGTDYNPNGCGYCFTSDNGEYDCALLGSEDGTPLKNDLSEYLGKKVIVHGKKHEGAVVIMCPISLDVESIGLVESEKLTIDEAIEIAQNSECTEKGTLTENSFYNKNTKTWWIDLKMKPEFENKICNPACVVFEETKTAEINWRCTGLLPEE